MLGAAWLLLAPGCRSEGACDVRQTGCQQDIFYSVLDVRGQSWDAWAAPPPMDVISREEYRTSLVKAAAERLPSPGVSWDPGLRLLGLLEAGTTSTEASIDSQVENVVAFYSSVTRRVTIIDRGDSGDLTKASMTLAHEIVHALQDRDLGLTAYSQTGTTYDGYLALRAMIEGEATLYDLLLSLRWRQQSPTKVDWSSYFAWYAAAVDTSVAQSSSRLTEARTLLPYVVGARYLQQAYASGGPAEVEHAILAKPASFAAVCDGYGPPVRDRTPLACSGPPAPAGYEEVGWIRLGASGLHAFAVQQLPPGEAAGLARAWSDDRLRFFQSAGGKSAVAWSVRLAGGAEVFDAYAPALQAAASAAGVRVERDEPVETFLFVAADDSGVLAAWDLEACGD